jgi:hypothetical protein
LIFHLMAPHGQLKIVYNVGMCLMSLWMFLGCLRVLLANWARAGAQTPS